ncbi:MAG: non-hydrolyzing UDP-N-acetylglucosamine 2-epimerase [Bdellovibrionales bacterium]
MQQSAHKKLKVVTILGTRPEIIRLSRVLAELDRTTEHLLVHTGQNYDYELNEIFFKDLELKSPDHYLEAVGATPAQTIAQVITKTDQLLRELKPDAVLVLGDTNSGLAALPAKRLKIPVFHMEAGNRCFDQRVPEEINRRIIDHTSDINLTYSDIARDYLLREGFPADRVIKTGSPMFEVLTHYSQKIDASPVLKELGLEKEKFFVVSCHREENVDDPEHLEQLGHALNGLADRYAMPLIFSAHPRTRTRLEKQKISLHPLVKVMKPLSLSDYIHLQKNAFVVLSDSGTITEESSILGFPALNIREAHERPEGMEEAAVVMTGLNPKRVLQGVELVHSQRKQNFRRVNDYSMPNVSQKVVRLILSHIDYVHRVVWGRNNVQ